MFGDGRGSEVVESCHVGLVTTWLAQVVLSLATGRSSKLAWMAEWLISTGDESECVVALMLMCSLIAAEPTSRS